MSECEKCVRERENTKKYTQHKFKSIKINEMKNFFWKFNKIDNSLAELTKAQDNKT